MRGRSSSTDGTAHTTTTPSQIKARVQGAGPTAGAGGLEFSGAYAYQPNSLR